MSSTGHVVEALTDQVGASTLRAALDDIDHAVTKAAGASLHAMTAADALDAAARLGVLARRVETLRLRAIARVDELVAARDVGAVSTAAWLRASGERPGDATRAVSLARSLMDNERVAQAMADGVIGPSQAEVITRAKGELPAEVRAEAEHRLVEAAVAGAPAGHLADEVRRVATELAPDGDGRLLESERSASARRELTMVANPDGTVAVLGMLDLPGAAILDAALDPLAAPRPSTAAGKDLRSPAQRRADALVELARRALASGELPLGGGLRPNVVVTMTLDQLRGDGGCAQIAGQAVTGPISAAAARRWACDAGVIPTVLGSASEVLDLGREARTADRVQRRALTIRDGGCAFPHCDRPQAWCEAHHIDEWIRDDGPTDMVNLVLLCCAHHGLVHDQQWDIQARADGRLSPDFLPPPRPPTAPPW